MYKVFQFAIILLKFLSYSCLAHSTLIAMILGCYLLHNLHVLMLTHTSAHACIVAHMDLYIIVMAYSPTLKIHSTLAHTRWLNLYGNDGTHTHKQCDMHIHSIPFINLLLCMFVQATVLMYQLSVYCCMYPLYKYFF